MPKVGKKHFSYSKKGKLAAKKYAARLGKKVIHKKNPGLYVEMHGESIEKKHTAYLSLVKEIMAARERGEVHPLDQGSRVDYAATLKKKRES